MPVSGLTYIPISERGTRRASNPRGGCIVFAYYRRRGEVRKPPRCFSHAAARDYTAARMTTFPAAVTTARILLYIYYSLRIKE